MLRRIVFYFMVLINVNNNNYLHFEGDRECIFTYIIFNKGSIHITYETLNTFRQQINTMLKI